MDVARHDYYVWEQPGHPEQFYFEAGRQLREEASAPR
jgi:hypothetical protein